MESFALCQVNEYCVHVTANTPNTSFHPYQGLVHGQRQQPLQALAFIKAAHDLQLTVNQLSLGCIEPYYPVPDPISQQVPRVSKPGLWRCTQPELTRVKGCGTHCGLSPRRCGGKCLINA